jgi:hypothetical protein
VVWSSKKKSHLLYIKYSTLSLPGEEGKLAVFEIKLPRRIFEPKKEEVAERRMISSGT